MYKGEKCLTPGVALAMAQMEDSWEEGELQQPACRLQLRLGLHTARLHCGTAQLRVRLGAGSRSGLEAGLPSWGLAGLECLAQLGARPRHAPALMLALSSWLLCLALVLLVLHPVLTHRALLISAMLTGAAVLQFCWEGGGAGGCRVGGERLDLHRGRACYSTLLAILLPALLGLVAAHSPPRTALEAGYQQGARRSVTSHPTSRAPSFSYSSFSRPPPRLSLPAIHQQITGRKLITTPT